MDDGLPDNEIIKLFKDSQKRIWIVSFKHALCYYQDGRIHTMQDDSVLKKIQIDAEIASIVEDENRNILISERNRITIVKKNGTLTKISLFENRPYLVVEGGAGFPQRPVFCIRPFIPGDSLVFCEIINDRIVRSLNLKDTGYTGANSVIVSPNLYGWTTPRSFKFFNNNLKKYYSINKEDGIMKTQRLNDSIVAINSSRITKTYNLRQQKEEYMFFSNKNMNGMMQDREGNIWFSSFGQGVYRLASTEFKNLYLFDIRV